jgi:16S rRNA (adenine1518-N6/adenine1519-N6)-dimethyltransferase
MMLETTPIRLLKKYNIRPLKRLGQSFLVDVNIIEKIIMTAKLEKEDIVVEIGAGIGVMTALIAKIVKNIIAVELDRFMIEILQAELSDRSNIQIMEQDILQLDFSRLRLDMKLPRVKVVGNIPYNISSPILFHLLEHKEHFLSIIVMLQKEVAERLIATPGTKAYGTLSVIFAMYFEISKQFNIPSKCFYPQPKVDSTVLRMIVRKKPLMALKNPELFRYIVRLAFGHRRKTLFNNIKNSDLISFTSPREVSTILENIGINGERRGETLTVEEFGHLSNALFDKITEI